MRPPSDIAALPKTSPYYYLTEQYDEYKKNPLTENGKRADALLNQDVQSKAITSIEQQVHVQLTQQQFDALVLWVFNTGAGGLSESNALKSMNACKMNAVPSDFTHFDHVNGQVSCGLYRRDMVSSEIWISGSYTVPRNTFPCPKGSIH